MADIAQLAIKVDSSGVVRATTDLQGMEAANNSATKSANNLTTAGKNNSQAMRNTALQLSQVAQQGAATGNYFQALAIQLPDLMLGFGTAGIAIGALAGAFAGPLFNALMATDKQLEEFNDRLQATIDSLKSTRVEVLTSDIDMLKKRIGETSDEMKKLSEEDISRVRGITGRKTRQAEVEAMLEELGKKQIKDKEALAELERLLTKAVNERSEAEEEAARRAEEYANAQRQYRAMIQQDLAVSMTEEERAAQQFAIRVDMYQDLYDKDLISYQQYNDAKATADEAYSTRLQMIKERDAEMMAGLATEVRTAEQAQYEAAVSGITNFSRVAYAALKAYGQETSDLGMAMLAATKILSVAQAVMAAETSAVMTRAAYAGAAMFAGPAAPAVIAAGEAAAQINRGLGYASAAVIAATEFAPAREYGGQVSAGSSYLVGERGPELITIGSQGGMVTPNKGLKSGGDTTVVFQISTGVQSTVRAEMMSMMPTIIKTAQKVAGAQRR